MKLIYGFMKECLFDPLLPLSWGIYDIVLSENYIFFKVNGLKYQGIIKLIEKNDILIVCLAKERKEFLNSKDALNWLDIQIE